jgi:hypothetical protein
MTTAIKGVCSAQFQVKERGVHFFRRFSVTCMSFLELIFAPNKFYSTVIFKMHKKFSKLLALSENYFFLNIAVILAGTTLKLFSVL